MVRIWRFERQAYALGASTQSSLLIPLNLILYQIMLYLSAFFRFSNFGRLTNNIEFFVQYHVVFLVFISWLLAGTP